MDDVEIELAGVNRERIVVVVLRWSTVVKVSITLCYGRRVAGGSQISHDDDTPLTYHQHLKSKKHVDRKQNRNQLTSIAPHLSSILSAASVYFDPTHHHDLRSPAPSYSWAVLHDGE